MKNEDVCCWTDRVTVAFSNVLWQAAQQAVFGLSVANSLQWYSLPRITQVVNTWLVIMRYTLTLQAWARGTGAPHIRTVLCDTNIADHHYHHFAGFDKHSQAMLPIQGCMELRHHCYAAC